MAFRLAYFITPHGFGHASRAAAVMNVLYRLIPGAEIDIYTLVPDWFFKESLEGAYHYHKLCTDVGLIQQTSMNEDLPATLNHLREFFNGFDALAAHLANQPEIHESRAVICDISALGIETAHRAGKPSFLIENFTWDWIYPIYLQEYPQFETYIQRFKTLNAGATFHLQTQPFCQPFENANLISLPVSRRARECRETMRERLQIYPHEKMVLITMGGVPTRFQFMTQLMNNPQVKFVIPGGDEVFNIRDNLRLLPHRSSFYHPDLVNAADAVIAKAGYSTTAEVFRAGIPFGFLLRQNFREAAPLGAYIREVMGGIEFSEGDFESGCWLNLLDDLLAKPKINRSVENGADQIAAFIKGQI